MKHWQDRTTLRKGEYRITGEPLGVGGFGVTYLAEHIPSGTKVAIKTLNIMVQGRKDFNEHQEWFVQEAFCLAKVTLILLKYIRCFKKIIFGVW